MLLGPRVESSNDKWKPKALKSLANTKYQFVIETLVGKTTLTQWMVHDGTKDLKGRIQGLGDPSSIPED